MGDYYEIKELCGKWYIEYQSSATCYQAVAIALDKSQADMVMELERRQCAEKYNLLKKIIEEEAAKNGN